MSPYKNATSMCGAYMRNNISAHKIESRLSSAIAALKLGNRNVSHRGGKKRRVRTRKSTRSRRITRRH